MSLRGVQAAAQRVLAPRMLRPLRPHHRGRELADEVAPGDGGGRIGGPPPPWHNGVLLLQRAPKHVSSLFEGIRGCGMGELVEFKQEGEWCFPGEAMELLLPIEMKARDMVSALLEGLPEFFG